MAETAYRDPQCRIASVFPGHQCARRDGRLLAEPGEECFLGTQRPSLLEPDDEANAREVVTAVVEGVTRGFSSAVQAWEEAQALADMRLEQIAAEADFVSWLMAGNRSSR